MICTHTFTRCQKIQNNFAAPWETYNKQFNCQHFNRFQMCLIDGSYYMMILFSLTTAITSSFLNLKSNKQEIIFLTYNKHFNP